MADIAVNADLFRVAHQFVSKEETRASLQGVSIEPAANGGALLVATDGHRMIVIHDEHGTVKKPGVVKLSPETLKLCKLAKGEIVRRLDVTKGSAKVVVRRIIANGDDEPVGVQTKVLIDGTFPNWRRVVPADPSDAPVKRRRKPAGLLPTFNASYLRTLGKAGIELAAIADRPFPMMKVIPRGELEAAVILWPGFPSAFGLLMPMRDGTADALPAWFKNAGANLVEAA